MEAKKQAGRSLAAFFAEWPLSDPAMRPTRSVTGSAEQPHSEPRRRKSSCAAGARCFSRRGKQCGVAQPPQRDSVSPSFGSLASGRARTLIPAAGPPFPHANRFAGFARGPRRWGAPCAVGAGAHTRPRADEGIGPYARKRSGCPGVPFAAGGKAHPFRRGFLFPPNPRRGP